MNPDIKRPERSYFGFYKSPEGNLIEYDHPVCRTCKKKVAAMGQTLQICKRKASGL